MHAKLVSLSNRATRANSSIPKSQTSEELVILDGIPTGELPDEVVGEKPTPMVRPKGVDKGAFGGATPGGGARGYGGVHFHKRWCYLGGLPNGMSEEKCRELSAIIPANLGEEVAGRSDTVKAAGSSFCAEFTSFWDAPVEPTFTSFSTPVFLSCVVCAVSRALVCATVRMTAGPPPGAPWTNGPGACKCQGPGQPSPPRMGGGQRSM